jgi:hypothetical protein
MEEELLYLAKSTSYEAPHYAGFPKVNIQFSNILQCVYIPLVAANPAT